MVTLDIRQLSEQIGARLAYKFPDERFLTEEIQLAAEAFVSVIHQTALKAAIAAQTKSISAVHLNLAGDGRKEIEETIADASGLDEDMAHTALEAIVERVGAHMEESQQGVKLAGLGVLRISESGFDIDLDEVLPRTLLSREAEV